jgi:hypothetical protein
MDDIKRNFVEHLSKKRGIDGDAALHVLLNALDGAFARASKIYDDLENMDDDCRMSAAKKEFVVSLKNFAEDEFFFDLEAAGEYAKGEFNSMLIKMSEDSSANLLDINIHETCLSSYREDGMCYVEADGLINYLLSVRAAVCESDKSPLFQLECCDYIDEHVIRLSEIDAVNVNDMIICLEKAKNLQVHAGGLCVINLILNVMRVVFEDYKSES